MPAAVEYKNIDAITIADIEIPPRLRRLNERAVDDLAESLSVAGLMNPIWVLPGRNEAGVTISYKLIAGRHRMAGATKLGWTHIDARIVDVPEIKARLMEIVENLHRAELTPEERAVQRAEYARLTAVERGELAEDAPVGQLAQPRQPGVASVEGGVAQAARDLGVDRRSLRRDIAIASIPANVRAEAREAGVTTQAAWLRVADADDRQAAIEAERARATEKRESNDYAATSIAELILDALPPELIPTIISHFEATSTKAVIKALRRDMASVPARPIAAAEPAPQTIRGIRVQEMTVLPAQTIRGIQVTQVPFNGR
jgi:ParB/RepB/Spo0J family partition protein